jgi:hypothetical protein
VGSNELLDVEEVVLALVDQRDEAVEAARLILQIAAPPPGMESTPYSTIRSRISS